MDWSRGWRAFGAASARVPRSGLLVAVACALTLGGCNHDGRQAASPMQPRGATVAFDSIDGLPPGQFQTLVKSLNDEAQSRRLAVLSRESASAYRVRGYLAARVGKSQTTISWVWDVFDRDERRALRIAGEETVKAPHRDGWTAADEAMLNRIARASMDQLAAFLTAPDVAPGTAPATDEAVAVAFGGPRGTSPEAAGIYRIFQPNADPVSAEATAHTAGAVPIPLPRRRPGPTTASAGETLTLAASRRH